MRRVNELRTACLLAALLALQGCAGWASWENGKKRQIGPVVPERMPGPQEYVVQSGDTVFGIAFRNNLDYRELARTGPHHDPEFRVAVVLPDRPPAEGVGSSKRAAEQAAAAEMLARVGVPADKLDG